MVKGPQKKKVLSASQVLGRMGATETLISDRHAENMLIGLLVDAEKVEDPTEAWATVRGELCERWGFDDSGEDRKPFLYSDGVAYIPIHGILLNRFSYCWGYVTGYDFIRRQLNAAGEDPDVRMVAFDVDCPGGEAVGCDEMAREIRAFGKPTISVVNSLAASGGYWLACAADRMVCVPSGSVGSIGVYIMHMNMQKMLAEWGLEVDYIKAGKFKTAGNPYQTMTREERAYLQDTVDERMDEFCDAVAEFRGVEESVARDTQARVMRPKEAIALGLLDAAVSPAEAVSTYLAELGGEHADPTETEEETMAEMTSEERAAFNKAERERCGAILNHEEATGRTDLANYIAFSTDMTVEQAAAMMKAAPKVEDKSPDAGDTGGEDDTSGKGKGPDNTGQGKGTSKDDDGDKGDDDGDKGDDDDDNGQQARGKSHFENAMNGGDHPNVSSGKGGKGKEDRVSAILGAQSMLTGRKFEGINGRQ